MLVLSRKEGERIFIGDDVIVSIERIGPDVVRVGIEAPKSVIVHREEVANAIKREAEDARAK